VPQFRDLLARFRPAGAPGAASRVGVAVDRAHELSAELDPVLALLAATHAECERMVSEARRDARRITEEAQEQSAAIGVAARRRAEAVRAAAAEEVLAAARAQAATAARDAESAAQRPRHAGERRIDELVSAAVDLVRRLPQEGRLP
jgi:cell division septum initiation protein DivIVA